MKIGVDGGALSTDINHQFGNYVFTLNLIKAIEKYDQTNNQYILYTFSQPKAKVNFGKKIKLKIIKPKYFWSKIGLSIAQIKDKNDVFLALNQSLPIVKAKKIIGFSHGLSFYFFKELYHDSWSKMMNQHKLMLKNCNYVIAPSIRVKHELVNIFPKLREKIKVLMYGKPFNIKLNKKFKQNKTKTFFLAVGMNHRIKNFTLLKKLFIQFKKIYHQYQYELVIINSGVEHLKLFEFYKKSAGLLTTSLYESFNFPVLEALSVGCPVIGLETAIIPELKEFVLTAKNETTFIEMMNKVIKQKSVIKTDKLKSIFSWKSYVKKLISFYD